MVDVLVNTVYGRAAVFGLLALIIYVPFCLDHGVHRLAYGKKLSGASYWKCFIPFYNIIDADKTYFNKISFATYGMLCLIFLPIRVVVFFVAREVAIAFQVSIVLMFIGIALYFILNSISSFVIINDLRVIPVYEAVLLSILFPIGYMYINNKLIKDMEISADKSRKKWKGNA